jgi:hypothetical protein
MVMLRMVMALAVIVCGMGLVTPAAALDTTSVEFLGTYTPPEPADLTSEANYINTLIAQTNNTTTTVDGVTYVRSGNNCDGVGSCPDATAAGAVKGPSDPSTGDVDVTGWTYLIGKYDGPNGAGLVWFVGDLDGIVTVPSEFNKYGLSHTSLFNPTGVPEPATLLLVGTGLVAVGLWRRKR